VAEAGGLDVAKSCVHTGGREPARRLRNKIRALLPSMTDPLVVDFTGVEHASISFLDELLGRLADELGSDVFQSRVRIVGLTAKLRSMANNVIGQRLTDRDRVEGPAGFVAS